MGIICGPYSLEDWKVMGLLRRGIQRMEKKSSIYQDLLKVEKETYKTKYLRKAS